MKKIAALRWAAPYDSKVLHCYVPGRGTLPRQACDDRIFLADPAYWVEKNGVFGRSYCAWCLKVVEVEDEKALDERILVEELCLDESCSRKGTHWHPFSIKSWEKEKPGEYSVTLRVRKVGSR